MVTNKGVIIASLLLACGLYFGGSKMARAVNHFHNFDKYVDVKGLDERVVKSNLASWQISFSNSANDLDKIYQKVSDSQKSIANFLIAAGFQQDEIQLDPVSVIDNTAEAYLQYNPNTMAHYKASAGITLVTNKIDLVSQTSQKTSALIQEGIVITSSVVRYAFTDLNSIKGDMLNKATQNAREAASSFAKVAKAHLGTIRRAQQGVFTITAAGAGSEFDDSSIMKKVRIVTSVQFFLE